MNLGKIPFFISVLLVVIIISTSVIIPIVNVAMTDQHTEVQNIGFRYAVSSSNEDLVVAYDSTEHIFSLNGVDVSELVSSTAEDGTRVCVMWDSGNIFTEYDSVNGYWLTPSIYLYDGETFAHESISGANTVSFSNGVCSFKTYTCDYTYLLIPSITGDHVVYPRPIDNAGICVDDGAMIYVSVGASYNTLFCAHGTIDNMTVDLAVASSTVVTDTATCVWQYTKTAHDASNLITGITTAPPSMAMSKVVYVIPLEYTVISDTQNMYSILLSIIPIMVLIVPIMMVVSVLSNRRD